MSIEQFLSQQRNQGELESEGDFGLDRFGAVRKTLFARLPHPLYYLLQLGQGLVALRASKVRWAFGPNESSVRFALPSPLPPFQDLVERLQSGELSLQSPSGSDLLLSGIATALVADRASALLQDLHTGDRLLLEEDGCRLESGRPRPGQGYELRLPRQTPQDETFHWSRFWHGYEYEELLKQRFDLSPVPFRIAGLELCPRTVVPSPGGARPKLFLEAGLTLPVGRLANHRSFTLGSDLYIPGEDSPWGNTASVGSSSGAQTSAVCLSCDEHGDPLPLTSARWPNRAWTLRLGAEPGTGSQLEFVRFGCRLESRPIEHVSPALSIIAPADDLQVDASGYALVQNELYEQRVQQAQKLAQRVLSLLADSPAKGLAEALPVPEPERAALLAHLD